MKFDQEKLTAGLSYDHFRKMNVKRCEDGFHGIKEWSLTDWACALSGEVGEACNLIKKMRRGEDVPIERLADELADIATYLDLLAARLDINLGEAIVRKFNEVSDRVGSSIKI